jgi:PAS domain S-box-containing protein
MDESSATALGEAQHAAELLELGQAFFEVDREWRIVRVNANQERLSRRPRSETLGRVLWEVFPDAAAPETPWWREYHRCMAERVPVQFEGYFAPLDQWTAVAAYPVSTGGIVAFFRDVTAQKRAEQAVGEALRAADGERARLAAVLEAMPAGVAIVDVNGAVLQFNEAFVRIWGSPPPTATVGDYREWRGWWVDTGEPLAATDWAMARALSGGQVVPGDVVEIEKFDGSGRTTIVNAAAPIRDGAGRIVGGVVAEVDISAQARAEDALRRSEVMLEAFFEASPGILNIVEEEGFRYVKADPTTPTYFGLTRETIVGKALAELAPGFVERFGSMLQRVIDTGQPELNREVMNADPNRPGETTHWRASYFPVPLPGGKRGVGVMGVEITDLKKAETALREADRRKDEFLGVLSHELRNPLAPIRNALWILERADPAGQQARRAREVAARQVAHLTRLVDDLLDVTRIARGKVELRRADLDLGALARRTADDYHGVMQGRGFEFTLDVPLDPVVVNGDKTRLAQVLGNLLDNAAKFTPAGGRVTLTVGVDGASAVIRVRDTGAGLEPDMLEAAFEPFTQGKQTLARSEGGLGLGLALVKGIVALHGGEVTVGSAGAGTGAEFLVRLPLVASGAPEAGERGGRDAAQATACRRRVLIVEDSRDSAETLAALVEMLGHDAEVAYDGPSAIAKAREHAPDVVLCDIGLPGMDGYDVARQIRACAPAGIRLVAVTGYARPEEVLRAAEAGFDGHLSKPPDPEKLAELIR